MDSVEQGKLCLFYLKAWSISFTPLSSVTAKKPMDRANNDDKELVALGYKPSFKREFTNLATVSSKMHFLRSLKTLIDDFS